EAAAQRHPERRLRACLERADPLPRALDAPADRGLEVAAAGDLEQAEARAVEDPGKLEDGGGRDPTRERLLPEEADRGVDQRRHVERSLAPTRLESPPCRRGRTRRGGGRCGARPEAPSARAAGRRRTRAPTFVGRGARLGAARSPTAPSHGA